MNFQMQHLLCYHKQIGYYIKVREKRRLITTVRDRYYGLLCRRQPFQRGEGLVMLRESVWT